MSEPDFEEIETTLDKIKQGFLGFVRRLAFMATKATLVWLLWPVLNNASTDIPHNIAWADAFLLAWLIKILFNTKYSDTVKETKPTTPHA